MKKKKQHHKQNRKTNKLEKLQLHHRQLYHRHSVLNTLLTSNNREESIENPKWSVAINNVQSVLQ